jgi:predicted transcriptional regulator
MFSIFARPKPCRIMTILRDTEGMWHLSKLAKSSDTTYVYVTKLMTELQKSGLVTIESKGKKKVVRLTEKGMRVANAIDELKNRLEG